MMLRLAAWYNEADIMIENNYHGFTPITWLEVNGGQDDQDSRSQRERALRGGPLDL